MPRMTVHMFGIMFFDFCTKNNEVTVLVPDGTKGADHIPPHYCSFFVHPAALERSENWEPIKRQVPDVLGGSGRMVDTYEFRIDNPCVLTFPSDHRSPLEVSVEGLLDMSLADKSFRPTNRKGAIATISIKSGGLTSYNFNRNVNAVQWTIRSGDAPLTIKADKRSITLRPNPESSHGAEVVFANAPDLIAREQAPAALAAAAAHDHGDHVHGGNGHGGNGEHDHFRLFRKIDGSANQNKELSLPRHRNEIPFTMKAMAFFNVAKIEGSCTPPCCKPGG